MPTLGGKIAGWRGRTITSLNDQNYAPVRRALPAQPFRAEIQLEFTQFHEPADSTQAETNSTGLMEIPRRL